MKKIRSRLSLRLLPFLLGAPWNKNSFAVTQDSAVCSFLSLYFVLPPIALLPSMRSLRRSVHVICMVCLCDDGDPSQDNLSSVSCASPHSLLRRAHLPVGPFCFKSHSHTKRKSQRNREKKEQNVRESRQADGQRQWGHAGNRRAYSKTRQSTALCKA